ncbi:HipA domain-containing protein [Brevibacillus agri]|uniref:HipA domain-containing protein n=1 Tax=Brevibacillus agri TaxID=51101 RepID=UPI002E1F1BA8|nr:HipA domain-containing protein [Brevibacillus agri]
MYTFLGLFKLPVSLTSSTWKIEGESTGEMWAEKIASEIGKILGFSTHTVDIACVAADDEIVGHYGLDISKLDSGMIYGALCHSFLVEGEESLVEGADMIMEYDFTYNRDILRGEFEVYSYELLEKIFRKYNFIEELYKMMVFDTLIGNTDRHQDNFGIIRNEKTNEIRFAPFYDNSSSLGRELPQHKIMLMMRDKQMFDAYLFGRKSSSLIKWGNIQQHEKLNIFSLFQKIRECTPEISKYVSRIEQLSDNLIIQLLEKVPDVVMTDLQKQFVIRLLITRRDYMLREFSHEN